MEVHAPIQLAYVVVRPLTVRHDVGARKAPLPDQKLQCRCRSVAYPCHTTQPTLPLIHKSSTVLLPVKEVGFVDFDNNGVSIVVETVKLNSIPPDICRADIPVEI